MGVAYSILKDGEPDLGLVNGDDSVPSPQPEVASGSEPDASHQADSHSLNPDGTPFNPEENCTKSDPGVSSEPNRDPINLQSSPD